MRSQVILVSLWAGQDASTLGVVPFLLHNVRVAIPGNIGTVGASGTEVPDTLIADFLAARVIPGIDERVCCCLHLLVGGNIDCAIGIMIAIRTGGRTTGILACPGVGHSGVDGIGAKVVMIRAEVGETTYRARADNLIFGREDKEDVRDTWCPAIYTHSMRDFVLDILVLKHRQWIGRRVYPRCCQRGVAGI